MKRLKNLPKLLESHPRVTLGAILVLFSGIVLGNMTRWSIWFDEAFSAYLVRFSFVDIVKFTAVDVHPPLYYWLLKVWTSIFGVSELAVRSMSLLFAVVGLVGIYVLIRKLFRSERWALVATFAAALSPMLVRFSDEARMYTLVFAIVIWATYVLVLAIESGARKWWIVYGVLLATGMYTHYFVALAWLAHWGWRWYEVRQGRQKAFWTPAWLKTHILALGLFLPWLPVAVYQFGTIQAGFWIPPLNAYTPVDYLSNTLLYREYGAVKGWWAIAFYGAVASAVWAVVHFAKYRQTNREVGGVPLVLSLVIVPPLLLMVASIPPLSSTFIDRYVLYSQVLLSVAVALGLLVLMKRRAKLAGLLALGLLIVSVFGIYSVYYYGNFNKNSATSIRVSNVIDEITMQGDNGQPIVAATPWIYYEAAFYDGREHRVYYVDSTVNYRYGSVRMLQNDPTGKITDLNAFSNRHRYIWYLGSDVNGDIAAPVASWRAVKSVGAYDYIQKHTRYRATLFDTQPDMEKN